MKHPNPPTLPLSACPHTPSLHLHPLRPSCSQPHQMRHLMTGCRSDRSISTHRARSFHVHGNYWPVGRVTKWLKSAERNLSSCFQANIPDLECGELWRRPADICKKNNIFICVWTQGFLWHLNLLISRCVLPGNLIIWLRFTIYAVGMFLYIIQHFNLDIFSLFFHLQMHWCCLIQLTGQLHFCKSYPSNKTLIQAGSAETIIMDI